MNSITVKAYAKINLGLDVLRKRPDGYHDVSMIMQTVNLYDTINIKKTKFQSITVGTNLYYLPTDRRNLAYKAALLFDEIHPIRSGLNIFINKRIPVAAGLAGGSADAAAVLKGLNRLFQADLSLDELMKLGVKIGADVPYCLLMGTALSEGIGEILKPLDPMPDCYILLVKPEISVSTKHVYENLKLDNNTRHPDIPAMLNALKENDIYRLTSLMENILESVTIKEYAVIGDIKENMMDKKALTALMSGSGPTVFGIFDDQNKAENAYRYFKSSGYGKQVVLTKPYFPNSANR
ncbi:MAG TPA: 4-(cytidine 5'-diphospho)-2-C-methyl-D-erythritol kinase [Clostridiales bacterium]|jgi:4-diphosphocytidyl-2-C-methyl-D-erythritol kinase|nr:4-(cytidine 5'-diphospho)-2-C-methyl-D-erythritol kinase [Clostridiales bacterium]